MSTPTTEKKRKLSLPLVIAGGVSSLVLALGMSPTFSAFTASITNNANNASSGTLIMEESDGTTTCRSDAVSLANNTNATCAIDKYGPNTPLAPGGSLTTSITVKNAGTLKANTFTMAPGTCSQTITPTGGAADACSKFQLKVYAAATATGTPIYTGTAAGFTTAITLPAVNPGQSLPYTFVITLDSTVASNAYQGITISQPIVWTFQS